MWCSSSIFWMERFLSYILFFFNDTAPTEISPLSLHDALPISFLSTPAGGRVPRRRHPVLRVFPPAAALLLRLCAGLLRAAGCDSAATGLLVFLPERERVLQIGRAHV